MCALLVGLPAIAVVGVEDVGGEALRVHVETTATVVGCAGCGTRAWSKDQRPVTLVDLPAFGRPAVLVWHKRRWRCPDPACDVGSFTEHHPEIAAPRAGVTDRAGRWMTDQVGHGRPVSAVAAELGCDWHTVMDAVVAYGIPLIEDPARIRDRHRAWLGRDAVRTHWTLLASIVGDLDRRCHPPGAAARCRGGSHG